MKMPILTDLKFVEGKNPALQNDSLRNASLEPYIHMFRSLGE